MSAESRDSRGQACHILRSYLGAVHIPFTYTRSSLTVKGTGTYRDLKVNFGKTTDINGEDELNLDPSDVTSAEMKRILKAFHAVTERAGYGRPMPVDRGQAPSGQIDYHEHYELSYLRHRILHRTPNAADMGKIEALVPHIRNAAQRLMYRSGATIAAMGHSEDDLVNIGRVHALVFLHNYAYQGEAYEKKEINLFVEYINQRFREFASITAKKAANSASPELMHYAPRATHDQKLENDFDISDSSEPSLSFADEEYEEGEYRILSRSGTRHTLRVENDGFLGLDMYLDGRLMTEREVSVFRTRLASGDYTLESDQETEEESASRVYQRKVKAREELYSRLGEMDPARRELVLSYAAMTTHYSPDARDAARDLCDELMCPTCSKRVFAGLTCKDCGAVAVSRFGVDYVAYRNQLREKQDNLADAMVAPLPKSKTAKKTENVKYSRTKTPVAPVVPVSREQIRLTDENLKLACLTKLPDLLSCCKCKSHKSKSEIGARIVKRHPNGMPIRAARNPRCRDCHNL